MDSLTIVLHSLSQWSEYEGPPDESLARKCLLTASYRCKPWVTARIYIASHKTNTIVVRSVVVSYSSCTYA